MTDIRSLEGISFDAMTVAFNDAFSDYDIPAHYTTEYLTNLMTRRGYRPDLAVGAFDNDRLVGFVFNCLDGDEAYNSGTGVVISHRRRGIGRQLMQRSIDTLSAKRYILEVIETNTRAESLYRQLGFVETRRFQCWTFPSKDVPSKDVRMLDRKLTGPLTDSLTGLTSLPSLPSLKSFHPDWFDMAPSWQNSTASLCRAQEPYETFGDDRGYIVVFPSNGDVPLLAVSRDQRRKAIGRSLLAAAAARVGKPLRIMNIDDRATGITAFLEHCGAKRLVRQIEMVRSL